MNQKLKAYIEQNIFEVYNLNEKGHGIEHIKYVIRRSFEFAKQVPEINLEMVYVIAAYHDIGHHIDAKNHEIISGKILNEDNELKKFFTNEQIKIMKEAVEDHRSSLEGEPRSVYGKIVSSADRNTDVITTLKRCYSYNSKHFPDLNQKEVIEKCRLFLIDKFGNNGYARKKMYFKDNEYDKYLEDITNLAMDKDEFSKKIKDVNNVV